MKLQQAKAYIDMRDRLITELCGVPLAAPTDLAKFTRLRQIASTTATLWDTDQSGKLDAAVELVDTVDGQVVVATQYRATVAALMDRLAKAKVEAVQLVGGMNSAPVQRTFTSGKAKALVMTIGAGAESLNLHAADTMIVTERPWNPATEEQLENRVYRPATGKEGLTRILHLMHPGSIDTYVATRTWRRRTMTAKAMLEILHRQEART